VACGLWFGAAAGAAAHQDLRLRLGAAGPPGRPSFVID